VLALSSTVWNVGGTMANPYQSVFFSTVGADAVLIGYLFGYELGCDGDHAVGRRIRC
jgi:hypothetical protein